MHASPYQGYRFPPIVIQHAVWVYLRLTMSLKDVEDLLAERRITASYETIRRWVINFGPIYARSLRAARPKPTGYWHLDEVFVSIAGKEMYLWRAVDSEGEVLDFLIQAKRDTKAALRLMKKLLRRQSTLPALIVTDRCRAYGAALRMLSLTRVHRQGKRLNNRAESSHVPIRRRERKMQGFRSAGSAQRFLSCHAAIYNTFNVRRHLTSASTHRQLRAQAFETWNRAVASPS